MAINFDREAVIQIALQNYSSKLYFDHATFKKDVYIFFVVRKMASRFLEKGIVNDKLIVNNVIICLNVFGIEKTNTIFRMICEDDEFGVVKSILIFLNSYILHEKTHQNQIMKDILDDISHRYHLHLKE